MALIRQIEASRGLSTGSAPSVQVDNSVARGIQQVAAGLGDVAEGARNHQLRLAERDAQMTEFRTDQAFNRLGTQFAATYAEQQTNIDPTGAGFAASVNGNFNQAYDEFLGTIPEQLRPKFQELALSEREKWVANAAAVENDQRNKYVVQGITETVSGKQAEVFNNPGGYAMALQDINRLIDTAPDLTPIQKEEARKAAAQSLSLSWAERMQKDDPAALVEATGLSSRDGYYSAIRSAESGGNDQAANPNSTAFGRYQFTAGTWQDLVARNPGSGLTAAGRSDPAQQEIAIRLFTDENAKTLAGSGISQTNGNLYAAHFLGAGDAVRVLNASGQTMVSSIVGPDVVASNKFLQGMTVAGFKAWAAGKAKGDGSAGTVSPELEALDFSGRMKVYDRAQAQLQTNITASNARAKAQYDAAKGTLELGITTGDVASEQSILEAGLTDSDTATLLRTFRTQQKERGNILAAVTAFQQGSLAVDPYSTDDRKIVDGLYDTINKAATPEQAPFAINELVRQAGVVPTTLNNQMRAATSSADPGVMLPALQQAQAISDMGAGILTRRDGGADIQAKADLFNVYTHDMGYTPEQAAQRIAATNDPQQVKARDALLKSKPVTDMLKAVTDRDISSIYGWGATVGENPGQSAAMVSEYKSLLEESLVDTNGDQSAAKELATTKFQRIYGKSELALAGSGVVTRLPPEKTYAPLPDGSFGYIKSQLEEALKGEGIVFEDVRLSAYDDTSSDFNNGDPARYQVSYFANGQWQLFNLPFIADYQAAIAGYNGDRQRQIEDARRRQQQNAGAVIENEAGDPASGQEMTNMLMQQLYGGENAVP
ncbi:hypothetical protein N8D56_21230 [Devosia sp. A8/3-2]|nr:hypothetical protein N8D56_21230 [Devosia sp. A8/3-2]